MSNKTYDIIKWICLVAIPALNVFIVTIFTLYGIPNAEIVTGTLSAIAVLVGSLIGISSIKYNKEIKG